MRTPSPIHGPAVIGVGVALAVVGLLPVLTGGDEGPRTELAVSEETASPTDGPNEASSPTPAASSPAAPSSPASPPPAPSPAGTGPTVPEPTVTEADVAGFYATFAAAVRAGDADTLHALLHPLVFDRYGSDQCAGYVAGVSDDTFEVEVLGSGGLEAWDWELDGETTEVADAVAVDLRISVGDAVSEQEAHLALAGDELRWFTDCGDPA